MSASFDAKYIKFAGSGGGTTPQQNLILWSEQLDNAAWQGYSQKLVTANQAVDMNGQTTLDEVASNYSEIWGAYQENITSNISTNTAYVLSFEASVSDGAVTNIYAEANESGGDQTMCFQTNYSASLTSSPQRFNFEFTTPATLTNGLTICVFHQTSSAAQTVNIGRVHLYQGVTGNKSYVTTTSSQVV